MPDYTDLIGKIPAWIEDDSPELTDQLPEIVSLAEQYMFRVGFNLPCYRRPTPLTGTLTINNRVVTLSEIPRKIRGVSITLGTGEEKFLTKKSESWLKLYWPNPSTTTAQPKIYAETQPDRLLVAGTPSVALTYSVYCSSPLDPLGPSNLENWLTEHAYDLLSQACIIEGFRFLRMYQAQAAAEARFATLWEALKVELGWSSFHNYGAGEE